MDSWWMEQAKDLLLKLRQNLPLTIVTAVTMSLIVRFWKKLARHGKQMLGMVEPAKEPIPSLPEGEVMRTYTMGKFHHGFTVQLGWRAALLDAGVVQRKLEAGRYGRRAVSRMIRSIGLGQNARVIAWRDREFPVVLRFTNLFASDHQPMELEIRAIFRIDPSRLSGSALDEISHPPEQLAERIAQRIALPAGQFVSSMNAEEAYRRQHELPEWSEQARQWLELAMKGSALAVTRVAGFRLFSPALDRLFKDNGDRALEQEAARHEVECNKVRGALRQAVLAGKLEEIRDRNDHEAAVRLIEHEWSLKEKVLRQELAQAEMNELQEKIRVWRSKRELLLQMLGPSDGGAGNGVDISREMTQKFSRQALEAPDSPFSMHEREQIRALLQSYSARQIPPEELLSAISRGADIPSSLFDPLSRIRGTHSLRVGEGWKIFDGESLWQIRLTRITTRRYGFLWRFESPAFIHFEMRGSPGNRRFEQEIDLQKVFNLSVGTREIPVEYISGTASLISLRIPQPAGSEPENS